MIIFGLLFFRGNLNRLNAGLKQLPSEVSVAGDYIFRGASATKTTTELKSGTTTRYTIHYIAGDYQFSEDLPAGTAIVSSQLADKKTTRTVFTYQGGYYVGSSAEMTASEALSEMKNKVILGSLLWMLLSTGLLGLGIWFQFISRSKLKVQ